MPWGAVGTFVGVPHPQTMLSGAWGCGLEPGLSEYINVERKGDGVVREEGEVDRREGVP